MNRRKLFWILGTVAAVGLWYLFRPELLFVKRSVHESFPGDTASASSASPETILRGQFHGVAHDTQGTATVYTAADGQRFVRFTDFATSNGPDVHVYLVAAADAMDSDTVQSAGFLELGALKGTEGDQNYAIPAAADLSVYRAVTIWCARFGVNFATAPLSDAPEGAVELEKGSFHGVAHESRGNAAIYRLADGRRVLRFTAFATSNGPDVQVYLGKAMDASDSQSVTDAGFFQVGALKGTEGDQNYELPADLDVDEYHSVTIWCQRFGVNFATAPLSSTRS